MARVVVNMKKIKIGGINGIGKSILVDDSDYEYVNKINWSLDSRGYAFFKRRINGKQKTQRCHRYIMQPMREEYVDHKNGNRLDNRRSNLRICTLSQNSCNMKIPNHNTSGYKGVNLVRRTGKWRAYIKLHQKFIHLGNYQTKEEAALVYNLNSIKYHGEFGRLNVIKNTSQ